MDDLPNHTDIEAQLRRYADHVEDQVGQIPPFGATRRPASSRRWPIYAAAAFLLVVGIGVATWLTTDDESGDPADDADLIIGEEDEPTPVVPEGEASAARRNAVIELSDDHVLVWGGVDAAGNLFFDGAVQDRASGTWVTIRLPLQAKSSSTAVMRPSTGEAFVAQNDEVVVVDLTTGSAAPLPDAPFPVEQIFVFDDRELLVTSGLEVAQLTIADEAPSWRVVFDAAPLIEEPVPDAEVGWAVARGVDRDGLSVPVLRGVTQTSTGLLDLWFVVDEREGFVTPSSSISGFAPGDIAVAALVGDPDTLDDDVVMAVHEIGLRGTDEQGVSGTATWRSPADPRDDSGLRLDGAGDVVALQLDDRTFLIDRHAMHEWVPSAATFPGAVIRSDDGAPVALTLLPPTDDAPAGELAIESVERTVDRAPVLIGTVELSGWRELRNLLWRPTEFGEQLEFDVAGIPCRVETSWGDAAVFNLMGSVFDTSDSSVRVLCDDPQLEIEIVSRLSHRTDGPLSELSPPTTDGGIVVLPGVTSLYADTAIQTLRLAGVEVATVFEEVPADSPSIGRVIAQDPAPFEEVEAGSIVTITVGESAPEEWQPISDVQAYRVVDGFLAALAAEDWEIASQYMNNGASDPQALLDIGLVEGQGDWGPLIADYCAGALCGADHEIVGIERNEFSVVVQVEMSSADGPVIAPFGMSWFEGIVSVNALPPEGEVGDPLPTTLERLFGEGTPAEEVVVARPTSIDWSEGSHPTRTLFWTGRTGGIAAVAGGEVVFGGGLTSVLDDGFGRQVSTAVFAGASAADGRPVVFGYDEELLGLVAYDVAGVEAPSTVVIDGDAERRAHSASVGDRFIAVTVGFGHSGWIEVSERDGFTAVTDTTRRLDLEDFSIGGALLAPDDSSLVVFTAPDFPTPFDAIEQYSLDGDRLGGWAVPEGEAFSGALDFDGRWVVAGLVSGRVFVIDTVADTARLTDVYAQVFFD